mmetsp:Transcript_21384/g.63305  ORF Transcript_21384/g.63305 Transcript_21384/m.63305 type:complete len:355 (+) Transcript_21384:1671-2735(+)
MPGGGGASPIARVYVRMHCGRRRTTDKRARTARPRAPRLEVEPRGPRGVVADQRPRTHRIGHWEFDESLRMFSHRRRYLARIHTLQSAVTTPCTTAPYTREDVTVVTTTRAALAKTDRERNAAHRATNSSPNLECTRRSNYALRTATPRSARLLLLSRLFLLLGVVKAAVGRAVEQVVVPIERSRLLQRHRRERIRAREEHPVARHHPLLALLALLALFVRGVGVQSSALAHRRVDALERVAAGRSLRGLARRHQSDVLPARLLLALALRLVVALLVRSFRGLAIAIHETLGGAAAVGDASALCASRLRCRLRRSQLADVLLWVELHEEAGVREGTRVAAHCVHHDGRVEERES